MGGFFAGIVVIGSLFALFAGASWFMQKFMGTKPVSRNDIGKAYQEAEKDKEAVERLLLTDPENIGKAFDECERKGYIKTYTNVLAEYRRITNLQS